MADMADVADGCVADGCCTVVQMAAEQHPDLRLDLEDWSVAKLKGLEHPDWRLAEDLVAVEESVIRCLGRDTFLDELDSSVSPVREAPPLFNCSPFALLCCARQGITAATAAAHRYKRQCSRLHLHFDSNVVFRKTRTRNPTIPTQLMQLIAWACSIGFICM